MSLCNASRIGPRTSESLGDAIGRARRSFLKRRRCTPTAYRGDRQGRLERLALDDDVRAPNKRGLNMKIDALWKYRDEFYAPRPDCR